MLFLPLRALLLSLALGLAAVVEAGAQAPPPGADPNAALAQTYNEAIGAFQKGDYATTTAKLEDVLSKAPPGSQLEPLYFTLGAAYFNAGNYDRAADILKTYIEKYPQSNRLADAVYSLGQAYYLSKDYTNAATAFARLQSFPRLYAQGLLYEGMSHKQAGDNPAAIATFEKLTANGIDSPVKVNGAMILADLYGQEKQADKAQALLDKIFAKSDMVDDLVRLNALAASMGDHFLGEENGPQALATYRHLRTRDEIIQFQAAKLAAIQAQFADNVAQMRLNPSQAANYLALNNSLQADIVKAKSLYDAAVKLSDFTPGLLLREGRAWYFMGGKWEAIVAFRRLLEKYPQAKERETATYSLITCYSDVNQPERSRDYCLQYLKEFPKGRNADSVAYMLGAAALEANDNEKADTYFGRALRERPDSSFREQEELMLGNAQFGEGKMDEAIDQYKKYLTDFPSGQYKEEANYRIGMAMVFDGKYEEAMKSITDYLQQYPTGTFVADAKYRLMLCKYAASQYSQVITDADTWQNDFPKNDLAGEVLSLEADALASSGSLEQAVPVYVMSYKKAVTDQVLNYSLGEAAKNMQKLGRWEDINNLFQEYAKDHADTPSVLAAMWISRAYTHLGNPGQAKSYIVDQLKNYIGDPKQETVEQLLQQLAQLCLHRPRTTPPRAPVASGTDVATSGSAASATSGSGIATTGTSAPATSGSEVATSGSAAPIPTPIPYNAMEELDKQLAPLADGTNPTTNARLIYTHAELDSSLRKHDEHDRLIGQIATQFKPDQLSPLLLAQSGDWLLESGSLDQASSYYNELKEFFPSSIYLDYSYIGLGEIAFRGQHYEDALRLFTDASDKYAGSRIKDATVGEAKTLLEMGRYDEARKLFEQIASVREWRGESTAFAVYSMGDIEERQGHWPEAIAHYQRVFVLYQRYLPWVAKAYIGSAKSFDKMGKRDEAIAHLHEMLRNEKLQNLPEAAEAKQLLSDWGAPA